MTTTLFELEAIGGPWGRRASRRRAIIATLPWHTTDAATDPAARARAGAVWTQSAFSEYASAAAFAQIASHLLMAGAPIDLVSAAGEFVADEMLHAELAARVAIAFGHAVPLAVDLEKLARPPTGDSPLLRAATLIVRTSCVGEALTVPMLKTARAHAGCELVEAVIARIVQDESAHAELGWWFLDWADGRLTDADREHLASAAATAIESLTPAARPACEGQRGLGVLDCAVFDPSFHAAVESRVVRPLRARGIDVRVAA
jgi:hypothetical protein